MKGFVYLFSLIITGAAVLLFMQGRDQLAMLAVISASILLVHVRLYEMHDMLKNKYTKRRK